MKKLIKLFFLFALLTSSCSEYSRTEINHLINSDKPENLVKAFYLIGEQKDSTYVSIILSNPADPRITHELEFKGISVYQSKMIAMRKISGLSPMREISYEPDSLIIHFYCDWASKKGIYQCKK